MASIKNLKKDIHYVLGDIITESSLKTKNNPQEAQAVIDDAINVFDNLIAKIYQKNVSNKKEHFSSIHKELEEKATALLQRINSF